MNLNQMRTTKRMDQRGFTLPEVLVVTVLLALLSAILYSVISGILRSREIAHSIVDVDRNAHVILARMTEEFSSRSLMIPVRNSSGSEPTPDPQRGPTPGAGEGSPWRYVGAQYFVGRNTRDGEYDRDSLRFVTHSSGLAPSGVFANHGPIEILYQLQAGSEIEGADGERITKQGFADASTPLTLVREEYPASVDDKEILKQRHFVTPIAEGILSLNFRFQKEGKWLEQWRDQSPPLPEAIEITIGLKGEGDRVEYYRTAIAISPSGKAASSASS